MRGGGRSDDSDGNGSSSGTESWRENLPWSVCLLAIGDWCSRNVGGRAETAVVMPESDSEGGC